MNIRNRLPILYEENKLPIYQIQNRHAHLFSSFRSIKCTINCCFKFLIKSIDANQKFEVKVRKIYHAAVNRHYEFKVSFRTT